MFAWAALAQGLMRARLVIPADPRADLPARGSEAREQVLPDAFFFHAPENRCSRSALVYNATQLGPE